MVNKVTVVGFRGSIAPIAPLLDPPLIAIELNCHGTMLKNDMYANTNCEHNQSISKKFVYWQTRLVCKSVW